MSAHDDDGPPEQRGAPGSRPPLLEVEGLSVAYGSHQVVRDVSFALTRGSSLALVGESGSGKSTIARTVLRLLPRGARHLGGQVRLGGQEVLSLPERSFRPLRGRAIGFVPQDPANSLNAVRRIGAQAQEAAALLGEPDAAVRRERILATFADVGLEDPERVYRSYPHQLSGGMLQRVLIGLAILPEPELIVADEPTSALDVTIQRRILDLLTRLQRTRDLSVLLITHDLAIAAERTDSVVVLRDGRVQEHGGSRGVLARPQSEYAQRLYADVPSLNPERYRAVRDLRSPSQTSVPQIEFRGVSKTFATGTVAAREVSFAVAAGSTHALVGESGSGKTTAVRMLLGLERHDSGEILIDGAPLPGRTGNARQDRKGLRELRRQLQLVYQNPFTSLDPMWRVSRLVREPLDHFDVGERAERADRVADALSSVGLGPHLLSRRPSELSGGQRQRVAIARALVLRPGAIVLDEPTSAVDVTVQAEILDTLAELQAEHGLTYLFVSHDLGVVRQFADAVTVLERGRVVEQGRTRDLFDDPRQPYTRTLLSSIPRAA